VQFSTALASFLTIIGIPFGIRRANLGGVTIMSIRKTIVQKDIAAAARKAHTHKMVAMANNKA